MQADALLCLSAAIIAPTSRSAAPATFRPEVVLAGDMTRVLVEQLPAAVVAVLPFVEGEDGFRVPAEVRQLVP